MKFKTYLLSGLVGLAFATAALAAGVFTNGLPAATLPNLSGNETVPADTNLLNGANPASEGIALNLLKAFERPASAITYSTAPTPNYLTSSLYTITLTASTATVALPSNIVQGASFHWVLTQDATGSRTVTWATGYQWAGGTAPTLTTTAAHYDVISCSMITATAAACTASLDVHH